MKVFKVNASDVFDDNNDGLIYGVEWDIGNEEFHCEWFKTKREQEKAFRKLNEEVIK
tara:strand:- start:521 stop:691 length:171 start_codon:yes stop_codon:yes gene_type:complete